MPLEPVRIAIGGVTFSDWYSVDIDSDIFVPADAFSMSARTPPPGLLAALREGANVDVYVGDDRQMAGVIDQVGSQIGRKRAALSISGRDKGAFLVDNEAEKIKAQNYTLQTLAQKLLQPSWGIRSVIVSNEDNRKLLLGKHDRKTTAGTTGRGRSVNPFTGAPISKLKIDPGQKIATILDEHCRRNGVIYWLTAGGDLYIGKPNYVQEVAFQFTCLAPTNPARKTSNNLLDATVSRSIDGRYSEIKVVGQTTATAGNIFDGKIAKGSKFSATAADPDLVTRGIVRKLIVSDCNTTSGKQSQARADYEQGMRRLRGLEIKITVPGFRQDGRLFTVDTLAIVKIEEAGIDGVYYISQRRFMRDRNKDRTEITLHEKGVFLA